MKFSVFSRESIRAAAGRSRATGITLLIALAFLVCAGCSREERDWESAQAIDTVSSYEQFVRLYPDSDHVPEAQRHIARLTAADDDAPVDTTPEPAAETAVVDDTPGETAAPDETTSAVAEPVIEAAPDDSPATPTPVAPAADAPAVEAAAVVEEEAVVPTGAAVEPQIEGVGTAMIQLGAFRAGDAAAERAWKDLSTTHAALLGGLTPSFLPGVSGAGVEVVRLRAGPLTPERARALCDELKVLGVACIPVFP